MSERVNSGRLESTNSGKNFFIEGIFAEADKKNRNSRVYPFDILSEQIEKFISEEIKNDSATGELDHPEDPDVRLSFVSHKIISLVNEGSRWIGKALILDTVNGNQVKGLLNGGVKLGISTRGLGDVEEHDDFSVVEDGYMLRTFDIVSSPSVSSAYQKGIMEGAEWSLKCDGSICKRVLNEDKSRDSIYNQNDKMKILESLIKGIN